MLGNTYKKITMIRVLLLLSIVAGNAHAAFYNKTYTVELGGQFISGCVYSGGAVMTATIDPPPPSTGTATADAVSGSTCWTYTSPNPASGPMSTNFRVDGLDAGLTPIDTVIVTINLVYPNRAAIISLSDYNVEVPEGEVASTTIQAYDPDGDPVTLQYSAHHPAVNNYPSNDAGIYTVWGGENWNGTGSFTVRACDDKGACSGWKTGTLTVLPVNDPPYGGTDFNLTALEDTWAEYRIMTGEVDDGDYEAIVEVSPMPLHGEVAVQHSGGGWEWAPTRVLIGDINFRYKGYPNYYGSDTFKYRVCDMQGACSPYYTVAINVTPINDPPTTSNINITTDEDVWSGYANVSAMDPDGDPMTLIVVAPPNNGTTQVSGMTVRYRGNTNFNGSDTFTYKVCDNHAACSAVKTASVTVQPADDAPVITPFSIVTLEDTVWGPYVLAYTDIENDAVQWNSVGTENYQGSVRIRVNGNGENVLTFTPAPNWEGHTKMLLEACEKAADQLCTSIEIPIDVTPLNDPPIVNDVYMVTGEDTVSERVAVSATDPEGDALTYTIDTTGIDGGQGHIDTSGPTAEVWFTPNQDWYGNTTFKVIVCDTYSACADVVVHVGVIAVNDPPVLEDIALETEEDTITPPYTLNATDPDPNDAITYHLKTLPPVTEGAVTLSGDVLSFMPAVDWNGVSTFVIEACDNNTAEVGTGGTPACAEATVTVTVTPVNDTPTATQVPLTTNEDTAVTGIPVIVDPDVGDTHTINLETIAAHGAVTVENTEETNEFTYIPRTDWFGQDSFELSVCDQEAACSLFTVNVNVLPVNDPPTEAELDITVKKGVQSTWMEPVVLDPDPEQSFTFSIVDNGPDLTAIVDPSRTRISVLPNSGFSGDTTFIYQVCDQDMACINATAKVRVLDDIGHEDGTDATAEIPLVSGGYPRNEKDKYPITSQEVYRANGLNEVVTGTMDLEITWYSDLIPSIKTPYGTINTTETIHVSGYNFAEHGSKVIIPAQFLSNYAPGPIGQIFVRIIDPATGSEAPLIPNVRINVSAWDVNDSVTFGVTGVADEYGAVAKMVEKVVIRAESSTPKKCDNGVINWKPENTWQYGEIRACTIEWIDLPEGLEPLSAGMQPVVTGRFTDPARPASEQIIWKGGLLQTNEGTVEYLPALSNGTPYQIDLYEPAVPDTAFSPSGDLSAKVTWVPSGYWPAKKGDNQAAGYLRGSTEYDGLVLSLTNSEDTKTQTSIGGGVGMTVKTNLKEKGDTETMWSTVTYLYDQSLVNSLTLNFATTPDMPTLFVDRLREALTGETVNITGKIGRYSMDTGSINYDSDQYGIWKVRLYRVNKEVGHVEESGPILIDLTTGDYALPINITKDMGARIKLFVEATLLRDDGTEIADATIRSAPFSVVVRDASPVDISVFVSRENGPVPFSASPAVRLGNTKRYSDIAEIKWEYSTDGTTFELLPDQARKAYRIVERLTEPQKRWYRATTINRYSGAVFTSNVVEVQAYRAPKIEITGYQRTFIGHPVTWTATNLEGDPTEYVWEVYKDTLHNNTPFRTESGDTIVLDADEAGRYFVRLTATPQDATEIDRASRTIVKGLAVQPPYLRRPGIVGPRYVEVGKTYTFKAINGPIFYGAEVDLTLGEEWELPNGVIVSDSTVDYTIQPGDESLTYRVWVNGYKTETLVEVEKTFYAWEYEWPTNWEISTRETTVISPARLVFYTYTKPRGDIRKMGLERPTYTYNVPLEANMVYEYGNRLVVDLPTPGTYPIEVLIRDERGNEELATISITATDPPPLETDIAVNINDRWSRAPSLVTPKLYIRNPISGERVASHKVYLDGVLISDKASVYVDPVMVSEVGSHEIVSELTMDSGRTATATNTFTMIEGDLPTCTLGYTEYTTYTTARLRCTTTMGYVKNMEWYATLTDIGGEEKLTLSGFYGIFRDTILDRGITALRIVIYNDKGQMTEINSAFP